MKEKIYFDKPGNMLYPLPAVMVSCRNGDEKDIITVAWAGTVCSDPPMLSISVRKERYSHHIISASGEFAVNLVNEELVRNLDLCGCTTGAKVDKFSKYGLTELSGKMIGAPLIAESPLSLECKVRQVLELGSHDMFIADIVAVAADKQYMDDKGVYHLEDAGLIAYNHGKYFSLGELLGTFGYSVRKKKH